MTAKNAAIATFGAAGLLALSACNPPDDGTLPDLIPESIAGSEGAVGYCQRDAEGLTVNVRNQTNNAVFAQTLTTVTFFPDNSTVGLSTPQLAGGSMASVGPFPIPSSCFNPDCSFRITVDADGVLPESSEANNTADGLCIG